MDTKDVSVKDAKEGYVINNTKLVNHLIKADSPAGKCDGEFHGVRTSSDKAEMVTGVNFRFTATEKLLATNALEPNKPGVKLVDGKLDGYTIAVHDAICTLYLASYGTLDIRRVAEIENHEPKNITYRDIYRCVSGNPDARVAENTIESIKQSVEKLQWITGEINFSREPEKVREKLKKALGMKGDGRIIYQGYLLPVLGEYYQENTNKKVSIGIRIYKPILLEYATCWDQIITLSPNVINIPVNLTDKSVPVRDYLCKYIAARKNARLHNEVIDYATILNNAGLAMSGDRRQAKRDFNMICKILDHFKSVDYINDFTSDWTTKKFAIKVKRRKKV